MVHGCKVSAAFGDGGFDCQYQCFSEEQHWQLAFSSCCHGGWVGLSACLLTLEPRWVILACNQKMLLVSVLRESPVLQVPMDHFSFLLTGILPQDLHHLYSSKIFILL